MAWGLAYATWASPVLGPPYRAGGTYPFSCRVSVPVVRNAQSCALYCGLVTLERWLLPVANNVQEVGALPSFNIRDFVAHVASTFDGAAFDRNRAAVAAAYVRILQSLGVEPSPTLIRLASVPHRLY